MQRISSILFLVLALAFVHARGGLAGPLQFEKLLVFSGTNQVRVECQLKADAELPALELSGTIAHAETGQELWTGPLGQASIHGGQTATLTHTVSGPKPKLWSPVTPTLYELTVTAREGGRVLGEASVRFGFRSMEVRDGRFLLNGRAVFLRGIAINPPGRTIPPEVGESRAFAEAYVRYLKSRNVNIFRISTDESQVWFDVCDELGMMLYAGRYGSPPEADEGKRAAPKDFAKSIAGYRRLFESYVSHPSIVMYLLANELPVAGARGAAFSALLTRACAELKQWDPTRPYIGNAGYGEGREGDVCDVHRYWGWYYNSFLTYYNLRDKLVAQPLFGDPAKDQPLTFTECVGSFTGSTGQFNIVRSKQLAPQLGWIGHTGQPREDALRYQSFMVKQATESFRRMRPLNPRLAGIMPFTILFYNWSGIASFDQMRPKPAMDQLAISYQPLLLSWEMWTPQVYAGTKVRAIAHVINDDDQGRDLTGATLVCGVQSKDGREVCTTKVEVPPLPYFGVWSAPISLPLPAEIPTGDYTVCGRITSPSGMSSTNWTELFIAGADWRNSLAHPNGADAAYHAKRLECAELAPALERASAPDSGGKPHALQTLRAERRPNSRPTPYLYDPAGQTAAAFDRAGLKYQPLDATATWPKEMSALIIGERAWDQTLATKAAELQRLVRGGGRVLCLQQSRGAFDTRWLPEPITLLEGSANDPQYLPRTRPFAEQMNANPERPVHPVFRGLDRYRLALWSDYTGWDQTKPGFPKVYPVTTGFKLDRPDALARTAILADYDRGLEGIALCEMFDGAGSVILSGFDLIRRAGLDPAADRLLTNLVAYILSASGHEICPLVEQPIRWGDYPTEQGTVCGSLNGLLVNAEWVPSPINPSAAPMPPNTGSWNMAPGDQFVPRGRNTFGPYTYTTGSSLRDLNPDSETGSGSFRARIPAGRRYVVTTVHNPTRTASTLLVQVNDAPAAPTPVAAGQTARVRTPVPEGATDICVRYTGAKTLVLRETGFE